MTYTPILIVLSSGSFSPTTRASRLLAYPVRRDGTTLRSSAGRPCWRLPSTLRPKRPRRTRSCGSNASTEPVRDLTIGMVMIPSSHPPIGGTPSRHEVALKRPPAARRIPRLHRFLTGGVILSSSLASLSSLGRWLVRCRFGIQALLLKLKLGTCPRCPGKPGYARPENTAHLCRFIHRMSASAPTEKQPQYELKRSDPIFSPGSTTVTMITCKAPTAIGSSVTST